MVGFVSCAPYLLYILPALQTRVVLLHVILQDGTSPLHVACTNGSTAIVDVLLKAEAEVDVADCVRSCVMLGSVIHSSFHSLALYVLAHSFCPAPLPRV